MTSLVGPYRLSPQGVDAGMVLLDTVGYGHSGPKQDQVEATREAAQQADLLLLVLHARNPARQADLDMPRDLGSWFERKPERKMPAVLAVMTHIDLLSPAMEWAALRLAAPEAAQGEEHPRRAGGGGGTTRRLRCGGGAGLRCTG